MDALSRFVCLVRGFRSSGGSRYPCHWCGILTTLLDAEDFFVCERCQNEYMASTHEAMKEKYPLAGTDERNSLFFKEQTGRHIARAKRLTNEELHLLIQRGCVYEKGYAQDILDGKTLDERAMEWLGMSAEQYVDNWQ